jgi:hypothetical protein
MARYLVVSLSYRVAIRRIFRCSAHDVFDIYAKDYSPLSANFFWGGDRARQLSLRRG